MKVYVNGLKMDSYFDRKKKLSMDWCYWSRCLWNELIKEKKEKYKNKKWTFDHERKEDAGLYLTDQNAEMDISKWRCIEIRNLKIYNVIHQTDSGRRSRSRHRY